MKKYLLDVPDDWNISECKVEINKDEVTIIKPVDHWVNQVCNTKLVALDDDPYYGKIHERVADCVHKLRDHFSLGYINDPVGGIQALEVTTRQLLKY